MLPEIADINQVRPKISACRLLPDPIWAAEQVVSAVKTRACPYKLHIYQNTYAFHDCRELKECAS